VAALVLLDDVVVGVLALATVILTQVEFPGLYWSLVYLERPVIVILVARNALLLATFVMALVRLWRLAQLAAEGEEDSAARAAVAGPTPS
jgi:hypothetical protein